MVGGSFPLPADVDVVVRAVHGGAHQVGGAGVHADIVLVDFLFMHRVGHQPAVGPGHIAAQLRLDGDMGFRRVAEDTGVFLPYAIPDGGDIGGGNLGTVRDTDAAGQVHEGQGHITFCRHVRAKLEQNPCQLGIIRIVDCVAGQEGVQTEALGPQFF